jgi:hypothetical protein
MNLRTVLPELLPPAAADCAWGVRWHSQIKIRVINPLGRSTYPKQKSVSTSGATPQIEALHDEAIGQCPVIVRCRL